VRQAGQTPCLALRFLKPGPGFSRKNPLQCASTYRIFKGVYRTEKIGEEEE